MECVSVKEYSTLSGIEPIGTSLVGGVRVGLFIWADIDALGCRARMHASIIHACLHWCVVLYTEGNTVFLKHNELSV